MLNETATVLVLSLTNKSCTERFGRVQCYLTKHGQNFAYFLLALALLPQIIHLFKSTHRYIAGVSYIWIIIRIFALISLILAHSFHWRSILEFIGLLMTMFIFAEIIIFSNNLHRQNKIILIVISGLLWIIGKFLVYFLVKDRRVLINLVYILFAIQMLPQVKKTFEFSFDLEIFLSHSFRFYSMHCYVQQKLYRKSRSFYYY